MSKKSERYNHVVDQTWVPDGSDDVVIKWHWPKGTLEKRMSAYELMEFVWPHLPSVLPFFINEPEVHKYLVEIMHRFLVWPKEVLDEVTPWLQPEVGLEEDGHDTVVLNLRAKKIPKKFTNFVLN